MVAGYAAAAGERILVPFYPMAPASIPYGKHVRCHVGEFCLPQHRACVDQHLGILGSSRVMRPSLCVTSVRRARSWASLPGCQVNFVVSVGALTTAKITQMTKHAKQAMPMYIPRFFINSPGYQQLENTRQDLWDKPRILG